MSVAHLDCDLQGHGRPGALYVQGHGRADGVVQRLLERQEGGQDGAAQPHLQRGTPSEPDGATAQRRRRMRDLRGSGVLTPAGLQLARRNHSAAAPGGRTRTSPGCRRPSAGPPGSTESTTSMPVCWSPPRPAQADQRPRSSSWTRRLRLTGAKASSNDGVFCECVATAGLLGLNDTLLHGSWFAVRR